MNGPLGVRRLVDDAGELLNGAAKMEAHHTRMAERAKARGMSMPPQPRHDACASFDR